MMLALAGPTLFALLFAVVYLTVGLLALWRYRNEQQPEVRTVNYDKRSNHRS